MVSLIYLSWLHNCKCSVVLVYGSNPSRAIFFDATDRANRKAFPSAYQQVKLTSEALPIDFPLLLHILPYLIRLEVL